MTRSVPIEVSLHTDTFVLVEQKGIEPSSWSLPEIIASLGTCYPIVNPF